MSNPNIAEAGKATRFSKDNPPKNPGRKPSKLKKWIKQYDLSRSDVNAVFANFLFDKSIGEIEAIVNDKEKRKKLPTAIAIQLQVLINAAKKGDAKHLESILYMMFGRPKEEVDVDLKGLQLKILNEAEAKALES